MRRSPEMKAIIYTPYAPEKPGAAGMRVKYFAEALSEKGYAVEIVTPHTASGVSLTRHIWSARPNLVIATSPPLPPTFFTWAGARACGARWVLDAKEDGRAIHVLSKPSPTWKEKLFLAMRRFLYESADAIWFLTESDRKEAVEKYSISEEKISLVPNGVDPRIVYSASERVKIRKAWKIPPKAKVALYAGSIGDEDIDGLLRAFPFSKNNYLALILVHDTSAADVKRLHHIREIISEKNISSFVRIETNLPPEKMSAYFSAADAGIIPWKDDLPTSIPIKAFDYAGTGLPTIAKCSPHSELDAWMKKNAPRGAVVYSWSDFSSGLARVWTKPLSTAQRVKLASHAHASWDRRAISSRAVESIRVQ